MNEEIAENIASNLNSISKTLGRIADALENIVGVEEAIDRLGDAFAECVGENDGYDGRKRSFVRMSDIGR
jgi:hypothetical protein